VIGVFGIVVRWMNPASLDDIERETALELHAGGTENGTQGARGASLFANHFADIAGGNVETEDGSLLVGKDLNFDRVGVVDERAGNFQHQGLHFGDSELAI
jgi:hypothetical protein